MDIQSLTAAMDRFVQSKGWYKPMSSRPQTMRNLAVSLNLEAAEVLELFQWGETLKDREALASELADVALYLLQLARTADINLESAILTKLEENEQRSWDQVEKP